MQKVVDIIGLNYVLLVDLVFAGLATILTVCSGRSTVEVGYIWWEGGNNWERKVVFAYFYPLISIRRSSTSFLPITWTSFPLSPTLMQR